MISQAVYRKLFAGLSKPRQSVALVEQASAAFGAKKKGGRKKKNVDGDYITAEETTEEMPAEEPVVAATPEPVPEPVKPTPVASSGKFFTLGDIPRIDTTPDHKAPSQEDTIEGRYASVLFMGASRESCLYDVMEDMAYLAELHTHSEEFRLFTQNGGVGSVQIKKLNVALTETAKFQPLTLKFLEILAENKRLVYLKEIAAKYAKLYGEFNNQEKITIISAGTLNSSQQDEVLAALKANPNNAGKEFTIEYKVDEAIVGGL